MNSNDKILRFAVFGNEYQPKKSVALQHILDFLNARKAKVYIDRAFYSFLANGPMPALKVGATARFSRRPHGWATGRHPSSA